MGREKKSGFHVNTIFKFVIFMNILKPAEITNTFKKKQKKKNYFYSDPHFLRHQKIEISHPCESMG